MCTFNKSVQDFKQNRLVMAKVFGPFLSISASGTVAKTLTSASWKGRAYMKGWFRPQNPNTTSQQAVRTVMADGVSKWRHRYDLVTPADRVLWNTYGDNTQVSGFNRFMKFYIKANYSAGAVASPQNVPEPQ